MKLFTSTIIFLSAGVFIGCGGGSSDSLPQELSITPTATFKKEDTTKIADFVVTLTEYFPQKFLEDSSIERRKNLLQRETQEEVISLPSASTQECFYGGIKKVEYLQGSEEEKYNEEGEVQYKEIYEHCKENEFYEKSGTYLTKTAWEKIEEILKEQSSITQEGNFSFIKNDQNYFVREAYTLDFNSEGTSLEFVNFTHITNYNGTLVLDGKKFLFKEAQRKEKSEFNITNLRYDTRILSYDAIIDSEIYNGCFTIKTIEEFYIEKGSCKKGEIKIQGKDHTITITCDKTLFDDEEVE